MADISGLLGGTGVALESQAYKMFGAAVENQASGALSKYFNIGGNKEVPKDGVSDDGVWDPTPYASALASFSGGYDPKLKFLFKVKFEFHDEAAQMASSLGVDTSEISRDITFVIKQIDLPKVDFEYDEVNMYNFKTKVLKNIRHRDLNIIMYDDVANHAMTLINIYMQILSPISRVSQSPTARLEDYGFAFNPVYSGIDTASRGAIVGNRKDIFRRLIIEQFYIDMSRKDSTRMSSLVRINRFTFANPRILQFDISDQDHEQGGAANTVSMVIDYDSLNIMTNQDGTSSLVSQNPKGDILFDVDATAAQVSAASPFINILARQGQRLAQSSLSSLLNKSLGGIGGGALSGVIYNLAGTVGSAGGSWLKSTGNGIAQGIAKPSSSVVKDNGA